MSLTIRCDFVDADFRRCTEELSGLGFDAKPADWAVIVTDPDLGMHSDYCPEHAYAAAPVYSLQRARKLRRRDQQLTQRQEATAQ